MWLMLCGVESRANTDGVIDFWWRIAIDGQAICAELRTRAARYLKAASTLCRKMLPSSRTDYGRYGNRKWARVVDHR